MQFIPTAHRPLTIYLHYTRALAPGLADGLQMFNDAASCNYACGRTTVASIFKVLVLCASATTITRGSSMPQNGMLLAPRGLRQQACTDLVAAQICARMVARARHCDSVPEADEVGLAYAPGHSLMYYCKRSCGSCASNVTGASNGDPSSSVSGATGCATSPCMNGATCENVGRHATSRTGTR